MDTTHFSVHLWMCVNAYAGECVCRRCICEHITFLCDIAAAISAPWYTCTHRAIYSIHFARRIYCGGEILRNVTLPHLFSVRTTLHIAFKYNTIHRLTHNIAADAEEDANSTAYCGHLGSAFSVRLSLLLPLSSSVVVIVIIVPFIYA